MLDEYCPDCGAHRVGLFRYCTKCGLDYDDLDARGELPGGPYSPVKSALRVTGGGPAASTGTVARTSTGPVTGVSVRPRRRRLGQYVPVGMAAVLAIAVVGALAIGAGSGSLATAVQQSSPPAEAAAVAVAVAPPDPNPAPTPTPTPIFAPTGETTQATVTSVIDGDTITVSVDGVEYRVRYIGVDAPALVNLDRPVEYMAEQAADANRRLVSSANVILERDTSETDQYGQLLRNVWVDQDGTLVLVGLELVKGGFARVDAAGPDQKYASMLTTAQADADQAATGMWGEPQLPLTGPTPAAPIETALPRLVGVDPISVFSSAPKSVQGGPGVYTWRSVRFSDTSVLVHWDLRASATVVCQFDWRLAPSMAGAVGGTVEARGNAHMVGRQTASIDFDDALMTITTTCPTWSFSLQGTR